VKMKESDHGKRSRKRQAVDFFNRIHDDKHRE
jgi:hypothetical protein